MYFGERLYQFPLGILGLAVATSIFPALSRHAAQKAYVHLGNDLSAGLRLVFFLGLPAGAGLWLLADPLATLFFQHGSRVTDFDMARVGRVVECFALGVWAFRHAGFDSRLLRHGKSAVPLRIALRQAMAVNLGFNLVLIWPWAESGLALSTSFAAMFQAIVLITNFKDVGIELAWGPIRRTAVHATFATAAMLLAGVMVLGVLPEDGNLAIKLARVVVPLLVSVAFSRRSADGCGRKSLRFWAGPENRPGPRCPAKAAFAPRQTFGLAPFSCRLPFLAAAVLRYIYPVAYGSMGQ